ncbi:hypothetical protein [Helicobacter baculiformis]|uniref:hypothetical protein n=1 Tax=Helicobacter baculiformis TaxID=427351 RepID=UPI0013151AAE|nr:hypothetical protein [Helicobacter baculiformis]
MFFSTLHAEAQNADGYVPPIFEPDSQTNTQTPPTPTPSTNQSNQPAPPADSPLSSTNQPTPSTNQDRAPSNVPPPTSAPTPFNPKAVAPPNPFIPQEKPKISAFKEGTPSQALEKKTYTPKSKNADEDLERAESDALPNCRQGYCTS